MNNSRFAPGVSRFSPPLFVVWFDERKSVYVLGTDDRDCERHIPFWESEAAALQYIKGEPDLASDKETRVLELATPQDWAAFVEQMSHYGIDGFVPNPQEFEKSRGINKAISMADVLNQAIESLDPVE